MSLPILALPQRCCIRLFSTVVSTNRASPDFSQMPGARKPRAAKEQRHQSARPSFNKKDAQESLSHCVSLVKTRDFSNYVAALLMPSTVQPSVFALLAFNVELAVIRDQIKRNSGTAGIYRLQFWKDAIEAIYGDSTGMIPRQPVASALSVFAGKCSPLLLNELVATRQETLGDRPFVTVDNVAEYGRRTHGTLMKLLINELSSQEEKNNEQENGGLVNAYKAADLMGAAVGIVTLLRSTVPLLSRGIVLLPDDLMKFHGLTADTVYHNKRSDIIKIIAQDMTEKCATLLSESRSLRNKIPTRLRLGLVSNGATIDFLLKSLRKNNFNLYDARLQRGYDLLAWRLWWRKLVGKY